MTDVSKQTQKNSQDKNTAATKEGLTKPDVAAVKSTAPAWILYAVVGIVVVIVLMVMAFSGGHSSTGVNNSDASMVTPGQSSAQELAANMDALRHEMKTLNVQAQGLRGLSEPQQEAGASNKALEARQRQSTTVYTAPPPAGTQTSAQLNQASSNTFAGQGANSQFGNQTTTTSTVSATRILHPRYTVASGEFIHAALETAINSSLPGQTMAVITQPVYAYVGERPLIPAGSRLIGQYSSGILQGQTRIMAVWNRIILPSGVSIQVNSPDVDAIGQAGQGADSVNTHFFARFGEASLLSIIGAGTANLGVNSGDEYNSAAAYRTAIAQSFQQSAQSSLQGTLPTAPTLRLFQGAQVNVFVAHDLSFYNVLHQADESAASDWSNAQGYVK